MPRLVGVDRLFVYTLTSRGGTIVEPLHVNDERRIASQKIGRTGPMEVNRRDVLKSAAAFGLGAGLPVSAGPATPTARRVRKYDYRKVLAKTGLKIKYILFREVKGAPVML